MAKGARINHETLLECYCLFIVKLDLQEDMVAELAIGPMVHNRLQTPEGNVNGCVVIR